MPNYNQFGMPIDQETEMDPVSGNQQQFGPTMAPRGPQQFAQPNQYGSAGDQQQFGPNMAPRGPQRFGVNPGPMPAGQGGGMPGGRMNVPQPMPSPGGGGNPRFAPRGPQQWMPQGQNRTGRIPGGQGKQNFGPQMAPRGPQQFAQPNPGYGIPGQRDPNANQGPNPINQPTPMPGQSRQQFGPQMAPRGPQQFAQPSQGGMENRGGPRQSTGSRFRVNNRQGNYSEGR